MAQTWSPPSCTELKESDNCNWTYSCAFCSKKVYRATSSCGLTTIPAVCSTLVMCFLCPSLLFPSSRHMTWYSLAPKNHPFATFDVLIQAFMLPLPQAKVRPVVCVLQLSSVHTVAWWDNNNHCVSVCGFTECGWVSSCTSYCCTKIGLYWPFYVCR